MRSPPTSHHLHVPNLASRNLNHTGEPPSTIPPTLDAGMYPQRTRTGPSAGPHRDPLINESFHVALHKANIRLLRWTEKDELPCRRNREPLGSLFSGPGVYIGPEDRGIRGGFRPNPASHVERIRDELLRLTRVEFPGAEKLYVLGPHYELGSFETPSDACSERGFFFGLDKEWPQELKDKKLSWGISLGLWDSAYYMKGVCDKDILAQLYEEVANAIYRNMADEAVLLVSTLMSHSNDSYIFDRSFTRAGWEITRVGLDGTDPVLLLKG